MNKYIKDKISLWLFGVDSSTVGKHIRTLEGMSLVKQCFTPDEIRIKAIEDKIEELSGIIEETTESDFVERGDVWDMACETVCDEVPEMFNNLIDSESFKTKVESIVKQTTTKKKQPKKKQ